MRRKVKASRGLDKDTPHGRRGGSPSQTETLRQHEVDFGVLARPALIVLGNPHQFFSRLSLRRAGHHIPRSDAKWIGQLLGQLSADQLRNAFRAAEYPDQNIDGFTAVILERIARLNAL